MPHFTKILIVNKSIIAKKEYNSFVEIVALIMDNVCSIAANLIILILETIIFKEPLILI